MKKVADQTNFLQHRIASWHKRELNSAKAQWAQQLAARLCVFSQLQETVGSENFVAISLPTSLPCFHEFSTMPLSKGRHFHLHYGDQSAVTLPLLELSSMAKDHDLFWAKPFNNNNNNNREKLWEAFILPHHFWLRHLCPQLQGALAAYCFQLRPSLGIALSCLTQGHTLPWELSTSNVCSLGGGIKPGREGVGTILWSSPQEWLRPLLQLHWGSAPPSAWFDVSHLSQVFSQWFIPISLQRANLRASESAS